MMGEGGIGKNVGFWQCGPEKPILPLTLNKDPIAVALWMKSWAGFCIIEINRTIKV
jgi:hypothetical protein